MKLIQYWDTGAPPPDIAGMIAGLVRDNPGLDHRLYDRDSAAHFIRKRLGERHWRAFQACAVPAMQADYFRLCALWAKAGVYVDADSRSLRPLAPLFEEVPEALMVTDKGFFMTGTMLFRRPHNAFLAAILELATDNIESRRFNNVLVATGPPLADAVRAIADPQWAESASKDLDDWNRGVIFGPLLARAREIIAPTAELRSAVGAIRLIPAGEANTWLNFMRPAYKSTAVHWRNWPGSIFREDA